ncbi:MAG: HXXEE domain-containing protein [Lysinibacillus sp.]
MEFLILLFCMAITIHNIEEAIWLPAWSQQPSRFQKPVSAEEFRFAVTVITLLAYAAASSYLIWPHAELAKWIFTGFLGSMIVNAIFPHLVATLVMKKYAPGMVTGLLLNIPVNSFILSRMHADNIILWWEPVLSTIIVGGVILSLIPLLFKVGRKLQN